ncbi:MAG: hypothetical protein BroJett007_34500 [Chloroflexota bacterium]|nr:MAG: hypothetical protein BroJett007_34500 [Chloroflexota bacterium]
MHTPVLEDWLPLTNGQNIGFPERNVNGHPARSRLSWGKTPLRPAVRGVDTDPLMDTAVMESRTNAANHPREEQ